MIFLQQIASYRLSIVSYRFNQSLYNTFYEVAIGPVTGRVLQQLNILSYTVPLNYNFTFTRVSTRVTTRGSRGRCQNLPWKGSFPRDGPWLFHGKTRGISRRVAFPRDDAWNFHETSYRGISRGIFTRPVVVALKSQWLVKAFTIRNLFTIELF